VPNVIRGTSKEGSKRGNKGEEIRHASTPHTAKRRQHWENLTKKSGTTTPSRSISGEH